jgi:hypothetical protein
LWPENFDHVKSLKLLGSLHAKYPTLSLSAICRELMGRTGFARIRWSTGPKQSVLERLFFRA